MRDEIKTLFPSNDLGPSVSTFAAFLNNNYSKNSFLDIHNSSTEFLNLFCLQKGFKAEKKEILS